MSQSSPKPSNTSQYGSEHDGSSVSSRTSSPDPNQRRDSNSSGTQSTPQMNFLQKQRELRERESQVRVVEQVISFKTYFNRQYFEQGRNPEPPPHSPTGLYDKPPIPPRGVPPPVPQRQSSVEKVSEVQVRPKNMNGNGKNWINRCRYENFIETYPRRRSLQQHTLQPSILPPAAAITSTTRCYQRKQWQRKHHRRSLAPSERGKIIR